MRYAFAATGRIVRALRPRRTWRWSVVISIAAIGIAGLGQSAITHDVRGLAALEPVAAPLRGIVIYPEAILLGGVLLALGGLVFALAEPRSASVETAPEPPGEDELPVWREVARTRWTWAAAAGLAVWAYLLYELSAGSYERFYPLMLATGVLAVAGFFWQIDRSFGRRLSVRVAWWEVAFLAGVVGLYIALSVRDLDSWRYSAIGDEYSFFGLATLIGPSFEHNVFDPIGHHANRPMGSSVVHAAAMAVFGETNFGWKMSNVVLVSATIIALYALARQLYRTGVAVAATAMLASSHYIFAYTRIGYDNLQPIAPAVIAFALLVAGLARRSALVLFAAGVVLGLSVYTFASARTAPVIAVAFLATLGPRRWNLGTLVPLAAGAAMAAAPIFAVGGMDAFTEMSERSVLSFTDSPTEGTGRRIVENIPRTIFAFNAEIPDISFRFSQHFLSGTVFDPVSGVLFVLGLAVALRGLRDASNRLVLIWLGLGLVTTSVLSPYDRLAYDRLHLVLPAAVLLAAIGAHEALRRVASLAPERWAPYAIGIPLGALLVTVLVLNSIRFWVETPGSVRLTVEAVAARAVFSPECSEAGGRSTVVSPQPSPLMAPMFASYKLGDRAPTLMSYEELANGQLVTPNQCIVIADPDKRRAADTAGVIEQAFPDRRRYRVTDYSDSLSVIVLR